MRPRYLVASVAAGVLGAATLAGTPVLGDTGDVTIDYPFPYCSWWVETSTESTNVAEPDTNAAYWTTPFAVGDSPVTINGNFVDAR